MTPASRRPIPSRSTFAVPTAVSIEGDDLVWESSHDATFQPGDDVLEAFIGLAVAVPEEMAAFLTTYGVPELCEAHGLPDRHERRRSGGGAYCPAGPRLSMAHLRLAARAFGAARRVGLALSAATPGNLDDWLELQNLNHGIPVPGPPYTWQQGRDAFADWLTDLLRDCGVRPLASWKRSHLVVTSEADGLLGTLAVLLARETGQGDQYTCDVCGGPVERARPPKEGEGVYCSKPACRREQQRRNQAAWRARKQTEGQG